MFLLIARYLLVQPVEVVVLVLSVRSKFMMEEERYFQQSFLTSQNERLAKGIVFLAKLMLSKTWL